METMHYREKRKNTKAPIIGITVFVIIGIGIVLFSLKTEQEPVIIGETQSDIQRLVELDKETKENETEENTQITYEVKDVDLSDTELSKIKASITLPQISVQGEELTDLNTEITTSYKELFSKLKEQLKSADSNYTYIVTYNSYDNMVGTSKILSLTVFSRVRDDKASKNTTEKITTYNIDLKTKEKADELEIAQAMFGKDYKTYIKNAVLDYVVQNGMMKESEFTYALTGLEDYYIKDGVFHIIFNEGKLVDEKFGVLDIEIKIEEDK